MVSQSSPVLDAREPYLARRGGRSVVSPITMAASVMRSTPGSNSSKTSNYKISGLVGAAETTITTTTPGTSSSLGPPAFPLHAKPLNGSTRRARIQSGDTKPDRIILYLRKLCRHASDVMAWTTAILWGERLVWITDDLDDLQALVAGYVAIGQYRQADHWLQQQRYRPMDTSIIEDVGIWLLLYQFEWDDHPDTLTLLTPVLEFSDVRSFDNDRNAFRKW